MIDKKRHELWAHMLNEHGITATESELDAIIRLSIRADIIRLSHEPTAIFVSLKPHNRIMSIEQIYIDALNEAIEGAHKAEGCLIAFRYWSTQYLIRKEPGSKDLNVYDSLGQRLMFTCPEHEVRIKLDNLSS